MNVTETDVLNLLIIHMQKFLDTCKWDVNHPAINLDGLIGITKEYQSRMNKLVDEYITMIEKRKED